MMTMRAGFVLVLCLTSPAWADPPTPAAPLKTAEAPAISVVVGEQCPPGHALVPQALIERHRSEICGLLGSWYIARTAQGGSLSGPGYRCHHQRADERPLGHALCMPVRDSTVGAERPPR